MYVSHAMSHGGIMGKKVKIGNIEIEINGKVIKLKLEEAQELKDILNTTFPDKEYAPSIPIIIDRYPHPFPQERPYWDWSYTSSNTAGDLKLADNYDTLRLSCG